MTTKTDLLEKRQALSQELNQTDSQLESEYLKPLMKQRSDLLIKGSEFEEQLEKIKDKISQIDYELSHILNDAKMDKYEGAGLKAFFTEDSSPRIIDIEKTLSWLKKENRFDLLRADILKKREVNKLIESGEIPEGIEMNSYKKFKVYKSTKKEQ